jgi:DNA-damage-inducible protein J
MIYLGFSLSGSFMMSSTTMVHVRVDEKIKVQATKALTAMGLSISDAVRVLLTRVAAEKRLPFDIKVLNAQTRAAMTEVDELLRSRRARFTTADDLFDDLSEDSKQ